MIDNIRDTLRIAGHRHAGPASQAVQRPLAPGVDHPFKASVRTGLQRSTIRKEQLGFTLIELMIVVAIIGILAAIAIPAYQDYTIRGQVAEGLNLSSGAKEAVNAYVSEIGDWPTDNTTAGFWNPTEITGKFVNKVTIANGVIDVEYGGSAHTLIGGKAIQLTPSTNTGSIEWDCNSAGAEIADRHLPAACR